jgi:carboxymethylenebutenolidase
VLLTIRDQPYVRHDRLGAIGFCAGGGNVFDLAVTTNLLNATVVFYGSAPAPEMVPNLQAPVLGVFAELDRGTNARLPGLLTALAAANKRFALHIYENTNHAFHNDTGARYDPGASCDAWGKTIAFFQRHLNAAAQG